MSELVANNQLYGLKNNMLAAVERKDGKEAGQIVDTLGGLVKAADDLKLKTHQYNRVVEQHFWAAVELGKLLNELCPHGGARPSKSTLMQLDISERLSAFARKCAAVHPEDARTYFSETNNGRANISHLLKLQTESETDTPTDRDQMVALLAQMLRLSKKIRSSYAATEKERAACVMFEEALG